MNLIDPTGESCERNDDKEGVTCKIDNPGDLKGSDLDKANQRYTRAVNRLLVDPDEEIEISAEGFFSGSKTKVSAGAIAESLISAEVSYEGASPSIPSLGGGKANAQTRGTIGEGEGVKITLFQEGLDQKGSGLEQTIIHEGIHGTKENAAVRAGVIGFSRFNKSHQKSYKAGAKKLFNRKVP